MPVPDVPSVSPGDPVVPAVSVVVIPVGSAVSPSLLVSCPDPEADAVAPSVAEPAELPCVDAGTPSSEHATVRQSPSAKP